MKKLLLVSSFLLLFCVDAYAATLYAKAAGGNWSAAGTWSNVSAGGGDSSGPPTSADNVIFELLSGNVTIDSAASARSLDTTSGTGTYGGTLTHNAAITLTLGDGTAGAGNVAIKLNSGMTYTLGNTRTSAITFASTSGTQQTLEFGTKAHGDLTFSGAGSSYLFSSNTTATGALVTHTAGTVNTNAKTMSWLSVNTTGTTTRTWNQTNSYITFNGGGGSSWSASGSNLTLTTTGSTMEFISNVTMVAGTGYTYNAVIFSNSGQGTISGASTFATITRTAGATKAGSLMIGSNITVTGTLTLTGDSITNRLLVLSTTLGAQRTITNSGATMTWSNVDFQDIKLGTSYDASAITGGSGDCGGNSSITFTTASDKYWVGGTGNWDDPSNHWSTSSGGSPASGSYPLPQDSIFFDSGSFSGSGNTVTTNGVLRFGAFIDWSDAAGFNPVWSFSTAGVKHFGSVALVSGMTVTRTGGLSWSQENRSPATFSSVGVNFGSAAFNNNPVSTSFTLSDAFAMSGTFTHIIGTLNTNGYSFAVGAFSSATSNIRTLTFGASTVTVTSTGNIWNTGGSNLTFNPNTSTIVVNETTQATSKTFTAGTSQTFNNITFSGKNIIVNCTTGMTINTLALNNLGDTTGVSLQASRTYTVTSFTSTASSGNVAKLISGTAGTAATLSKSSGTVSIDYVSIKDSSATGGASWYAGANSTNVSGNSGWVFTAPPSGSNSNFLMLMGGG